MTSPLQIARYDRLVRRLMNIVGEGAIVTGALPDVFPVLEVENLTSENRALAGWRLSNGGDVFTAAAGQFPLIQAMNPAGSGVICVVETVVAVVTVTTQIRWRLTTTAATNLIRQFVNRDSRFGFPGNTPIQVRNLSAVVPVPPGSVTLNLANTQTDLLLGSEFVLFPGSGLEVGTDRAAGQMFCTFSCRERSFEPSELIV